MANGYVRREIAQFFGQYMEKENGTILTHRLSMYLKQQGVVLWILTINAQSVVLKSTTTRHTLRLVRSDGFSLEFATSTTEPRSLLDSLRETWRAMRRFVVMWQSPVVVAFFRTRLILFHAWTSERELDVVPYVQNVRLFRLSDPIDLRTCATRPGSIC
eukprot:m.102800 g.102800  ORF g.102800 m.102800 type:complete len:159 (+) comp8835_c0_seq6:193-669(+)